MHEFSVSKDMKKKINNDKRTREGGSALMSNTNYHRIEN